MIGARLPMYRAMVGDVINQAVRAAQQAAVETARTAHEVSSPGRTLQARDTVTLTTSERGGEAAAAVIRTADEMVGTLVDLFA